MQTFNSFDSLVASQSATLQQTQMSVFNKEGQDFKIKWYNVGNYGEIAGTIISDGKPVGKLRLNNTADTMHVMWTDGEFQNKYGTEQSYPVADVRDCNREFAPWLPSVIRSEGRRILAENYK